MARDSRDDKAQFIKILKKFASGGQTQWRGEAALLHAFAEWLEASPVPSTSIGLVWHRDLPYLLDEAFVDFRKLPRFAKLRVDYQEEVGDEIPSLTNIHEGGLGRGLVVSSLSRTIARLYTESSGHDGVWLENQCESYWQAQWGVVSQAWKRFLWKCYRPYMARYAAQSHSGDAGVFGRTELRIFGCAGRVLFTFSAGDDQITYVADDSDMFGNRAGPNTSTTPYQKCVTMIDEITEKWDLELMKPAALSFG